MRRKMGFGTDFHSCPISDSGHCEQECGVKYELSLKGDHARGSQYIYIYMYTHTHTHKLLSEAVCLEP